MRGRVFNPLLRLLAGVLMALLAGSALAELVVVVNVRNPVSVMTRQEVVNLFFGRLGQFPGGMEAQPVDLVDSHPDRAVFYRALVGKDLAEVNAYWARLAFSGRHGAPQKVGSPDEVVRWVAGHPGGIGFVDSSRVDGRLRVVLELK